MRIAGGSRVLWWSRLFIAQGSWKRAPYKCRKGHVVALSRVAGELY